MRSLRRVILQYHADVFSIHLGETPIRMIASVRAAELCTCLSAFSCITCYGSAAVWVSAATRISHNVTKIREPLTSSRISLGISASIRSSGCICVFLTSASARLWPILCLETRLKREGRLVWWVTAVLRHRQDRSFPYGNTVPNGSFRGAAPTFGRSC